MGVETALTVGSMAAQGIGAGMSFAQASKQKKLMNEAQRAAEQATAAARAKLGVNYFEQLAVPMEAYEKEREALISSGAQAMQAGVESERGAAATAGRIQMAQTEAQAGQRAAMGKELSDLAKLTAEEESRLAGLRADLDISEAAANRMRERDAQRARARAMQQGFESVTGMIASGAPLINLYPGKKTGTTTDTGTTSSPSPEMQKQIQQGNEMPIKPSVEDFMQTQVTPYSGTSSGSEMIGGKTKEEIGNMDKLEYNIFINSLSPEEKDKLINMMNPFSIK